VIVVVVVVALILVAVVALGLFAAHVVQSSLPETVTVVSAGTVWNLSAGYYEYEGPVDLTARSSWTVSGTFTASAGIAAYVMTSSEYSAWGGSGEPSTYQWTSGTGVTAGSVSTVIPQGTYYFVWLNTNPTASSSVDITSSVLATSI